MNQFWKDISYLEAAGTGPTRMSRWGVFMLGCLIAGCGVSKPAAVDLDLQLNAAAASRRPVAVLVINGQTPADDHVISQFKQVASSDGVVAIELDISNSRNRAAAARFHPTVSPLLVCLSPGGLIVSREEKPAAELITQQIDALLRKWPELEKKLAMLERSVADQTTYPAAHMKLAAFEQSLHNDQQAIPHLEFAAHAANASESLRVQAWVDLVRAHQWIMEPEKGRHEAKALIATLGDKDPVAMSGGKLMLGIQDANAKRFALAREEFEQAIAAAPDSPYAQEARDAEKKLPALQTTQP